MINRSDTTELPSSPQRKRYRGTLVAILKIVLTGLLVYFLYRQIDQHWAEIREHPWQVNWLIFASALAVGLGALATFAANWRVLISGFGHQIPLWRACRVFYLADIVRYIPGKIWALLGYVYLARREGVPPEQSTASFVLSQMFLIPSAFLMAAIAIRVDSRILVDQVALLGEYSSWTFMILMLAATLIVIMWPGRVLALANILLRRIGQNSISFHLDKRVALRLFLRYLLGWFIYGAGFWLFVGSVAPYSKLGLVAAAGVFAAAYQIGYLSLFAPGGFGPRELVMGFMLMPFLGPIAPAVAVLARLWVVGVEILAALTGLVIGGRPVLPGTEASGVGQSKDEVKTR